MPDPPSVTVFARRVFAVVRRIPTGRVSTYGDIAALAGRPGAARAVGNLMRTSRAPDLPYHRVIAAGGRVGGYGRQPHLTRALLRAEGVPLTRDRVQDFAVRRWQGA